MFSQYYYNQMLYWKMCVNHILDTHFHNDIIFWIVAKDIIIATVYVLEFVVLSPKEDCYQMLLTHCG